MDLSVVVVYYPPNIHVRCEQNVGGTKKINDFSDDTLFPATNPKAAEVDDENRDFP